MICSMKTLVRTARSVATQPLVYCVAASLVAILVIRMESRVVHAGAGDPARQVFTTPLSNVPGKSLTAVIVTYPPGASSSPHKHAGSVYAFVLTGAIRSQNSATGPARVYQTGEGFFEPPESAHLISANASTTEPASLLAIVVADTGAQLTRNVK